jgi:hypothetical protein
MASSTDADLQQLADFRSSNSWLYQLLPIFSSSFTAIPWENIPTGIKDTTYISTYLVPAYAKAKLIYNSLNLDARAVTSQDAVLAAKTMLDAQSSTYDKLKAAVTAGYDTLTADDSLKVEGDIMRVYVVTAFAQAEYAFQIHYTGAARAFVAKAAADYAAAVASGSITQVAAEQAVADLEKAMQQHAQWTLGMLSAIGYVDDHGYLDAAKKTAPVSGLGIAPVILGIIIVGAVIAICAVAYLICSLIETMQMNKIVGDYCQKAVQASTTAQTAEQQAAAQQLQANCGTALKNSTDPAKKFDPNALMSSVVEWLTIGGLVVLGVYFAPLVVTKLTQARRAARSS